jgi:uncharacterized coiled-coil protein SlyX
MKENKEIELLQRKVSYLENYTDELNDVILELRKDIEDLSIRIDKVQQTVEEDGTVVDPNEKPPHY